jgi:hypothetical protein
VCCIKHSSGLKGWQCFISVCLLLLVLNVAMLDVLEARVTDSVIRLIQVSNQSGHISCTVNTQNSASVLSGMQRPVQHLRLQ